MLLYTHIILAHKTLPNLPMAIDDPGAYYMGAILPDARYLAQVPRERTHPSAKDFRRLARRLPAVERDLGLGYLVHLAADELALKYLPGILRPRFPRPLRPFLRTPEINIILETLYQETPCPQAVLTRSMETLSAAVGLPLEAAFQLADHAEAYLSNPTVETAIAALAGSHVHNDRNVRYYVKGGRLVHSTPWLRGYLKRRFAGVREALEEKLIAETLRLCNE